MSVSSTFWRDCPAVEVVPGRLNGQPVVKDSRVAAETIVECEELGETPEETAENYGLNLGDVLAIRSYYKAHSNDAALVS